MTLKEYRKSKKMRQIDLANVMNINRSTVAKWENGMIFPSFQKIIKLAAVLEISETEVINAISCSKN